VRAGLEALVPGAPGRVAAVDFDGTCVRGDLSESSLALLAAERGEDLLGAYEKACSTDPGSAYVDLVHTLCAGRTAAEVAGLGLRALDEGARLGLSVRRSVRELLHAMHAHGWTILLVTASAEPLVAAAARHLDLPPHGVIGMLPEIGADGRYLRSALLRAPWRSGKVEALAGTIGGPPDLAIGDSPDDEPMLAHARRALLLDHGVRDLAARARERGWLVQPEGGLT
jgi:phosphoserine phosphatase